MSLASQNKTVLVVDDSNFMRCIIKAILTKNGYTVIGEADNGALGLLKFRELNPAFVTLDYNMEKLSGLDTLTQMKRWNPDAKIVMISAMLGQPHIAKSAYVNGANAVLTKPIDSDRLLAVLDSI